MFVFKGAPFSEVLLGDENWHIPCSLKCDIAREIMWFELTLSSLIL